MIPRLLLVSLLAYSPIAIAGDIDPALGGLGSALGGIALLLSILTRTKLAERIASIEARSAGEAGRIASLENIVRSRDRDLAILSTKLEFISQALQAGD